MKEKLDNILKETLIIVGLFSIAVNIIIIWANAQLLLGFVILITILIIFNLIIK